MSKRKATAQPAPGGLLKEGTEVWMPFGDEYYIGVVKLVNENDTYTIGDFRDGTGDEEEVPRALLHVAGGADRWGELDMLVCRFDPKSSGSHAHVRREVRIVREDGAQFESGRRDRRSQPVRKLAKTSECFAPSVDAEDVAAVPEVYKGVTLILAPKKTKTGYTGVSELRGHFVAAWDIPGGGKYTSPPQLTAPDAALIYAQHHQKVEAAKQAAAAPVVAEEKRRADEIKRAEEEVTASEKHRATARHRLWSGLDAGLRVIESAKVDDGADLRRCVDDLEYIFEQSWGAGVKALAGMIWADPLKHGLLPRLALIGQHREEGLSLEKQAKAVAGALADPEEAVTAKRAAAQRRWAEARPRYHAPPTGATTAQRRLAAMRCGFGFDN